MRSVLFVCSANQCRSPMAMVFLSDLVAKHSLDLDDWNIASAGCWASTDFPATSGAISAVEDWGLDLTKHRSQPVTDELMEAFNLILCMEYNHKRTLQRNYPEYTDKIYLLSEMDSNGKEVDDPVGRSIGIYQSTADEILNYLEKGFEKILDLSE